MTPEGYARLCVATGGEAAANAMDELAAGLRPDVSQLTGTTKVN